MVKSRRSVLWWSDAVGDAAKRPHFEFNPALIARTTTLSSITVCNNAHFCRCHHHYHMTAASISSATKQAPPSCEDSTHRHPLGTSATRCVGKNDSTVLFSDLQRGPDLANSRQSFPMTSWQHSLPSQTSLGPPGSTVDLRVEYDLFLPHLTASFAR